MSLWLTVEACLVWWEFLAELEGFRRKLHSFQIRYASGYSAPLEFGPYLGRRQMITASSCSRGGLDWILGKISLLKEWSGIGTSCPEQWWSPHPWRGSINV